MTITTTTTTTDRVLAGAVLALLTTAALARPAWRAIDPVPAQMVAAREAWLVGALLDPWGRPWYVAHSSFYGEGRAMRTAANDLLASMGPDGSQGSAAFQGPGDDDFLVGRRYLDWRHESVSAPGTARYERLPMVLVVLALAVLLTRVLAGAAPSPRGTGHYTCAAAIALVPSFGAWIAVAALDATPLLMADAGVVMVAPALAISGSTYLLFFTLVFAHRQLAGEPRAASRCVRYGRRVRGQTSNVVDTQD